MTKDLKKSMKRMDTVYQWRRQYVRENKSGVCPTLTANMGTGGHNVPLVLTQHGIRKLTPKECFNLMGFPKSFKLPKDMALSHLYKQAGNAVVVPVIERIARNILASINDEELPSTKQEQKLSLL
jgi:DNA (cytosine-5)-methyltransferase 1